MQWTVLCTCYNYIYKQNIWHGYKVRSVGGLRFPSSVLSLHSSPMMPNSFLIHKHIIVFHALPVLSPWSTMTLLSFDPLPALCFTNSLSFLTPDQMSSGSLSWFSHTPSLKVNIYLFLITLQFPNIVIFTVISIFPNIVNSKPSYPTVLEGTQRSWMKSTLLATRAHYQQFDPMP